MPLNPFDKNLPTFPPTPFSHLRVKVKVRVYYQLCQLASLSYLKVHWRKDPSLDEAIERDKRWKGCAKVVKEVLNEPNHVIPLRYLEKRRKKLRLYVHADTFVRQNPLLFDVYYDRIRPKSELVRFLRPSERLSRFLEEERRVYVENEGLIVRKLCKLLMMAKDRVLSLGKLVHVKREFGFPNDFVKSVVLNYPEYFRLVGGDGEGEGWEKEGEEGMFLELVKWEPEFAKSVIMERAEAEEKLIGIRVRPSFNWKLPRGFFIKKVMREWVRDWMEMPYVNPYDDASKLDPSSREMEKRMVGVLHELLSLSLYKRIAVPILGKFGEEFLLSNEFSNAFTRHSGIFYLSLKGGIKTAVLREAYKDGVLVDRDPLLEIHDKFIELLEEGWELWKEDLRSMREARQKDAEMMALQTQESQSSEEDSEEESEDL